MIKNSDGKLSTKVNAKPEKTVEVSDSPKKEKRDVRKFVHDLMGEIKKITWPSAKTTRHNFILVMVIIIVTAVVLYGFDQLVIWLTGMFYNLF